MGALTHRVSRWAVAVMLLTASITWAALAPAHAAGAPRAATPVDVLPPCHHTGSGTTKVSWGDVQSVDPGCADLCAITDAAHFTADLAIASGLNAAKISLPASFAVASISNLSVARGYTGIPPPLRPRLAAIYLTTRRLRI